MKVLTAIGEMDLSKDLKDNGFEICTYDIQYKEGILEYIEINSNIDYLIIDDKLPGDMNTQEIIDKIHKINPLTKIIVVNKANLKNTYKNFEYFNKEEIKDFIVLDCDKRQTSKNNGKIIGILGVSGVGKSVFSINFANALKSNKKLIVDFDVLNNSLHHLLGIKDYTNNVQNNIKKSLLEFSYKKSFVYENEEKYKLDTTPVAFKTRYNIDLISGVNLIFDKKSQLSPQVLREILLRLKNVYEVIIIDTSSQCFMDYNKEIMKISDELIFLSGASLYEVQKAKFLLKKYTEEYKIDKDKFYIVFNKCTKKTIDESILKELFREYKVLGKIMLKDYYEYTINNNKSKQKKINKEMKQIEKRGDFDGKNDRKSIDAKSRIEKFRSRAKYIS